MRRGRSTTIESSARSTQRALHMIDARMMGCCASPCAEELCSILRSTLLPGPIVSVTKMNGRATVTLYKASEFSRADASKGVTSGCQLNIRSIRRPGRDWESDMRRRAWSLRSRWKTSTIPRPRQSWKSRHSKEASEALAELPAIMHANRPYLCFLCRHCFLICPCLSCLSCHNYRYCVCLCICHQCHQSICHCS